MKLRNITKAIILLVFFSINSCSSNDSNDSNGKTPESQASLLIGKWEFDKVITNGIESDQSNGSCKRNFLEFKNNICTEGHYNDTCILGLYPDNYILDGDVIKIIYSSTSSSEKKILLLNSTTLRTSTYNGSRIQTYKRI
jgi:hypothetical protein